MVALEFQEKKLISFVETLVILVKEKKFISFVEILVLLEVWNMAF